MPAAARCRRRSEFITAAISRPMSRLASAAEATTISCGVSPNGKDYFPIFLFTSFTLMTDHDVLGLRPYLATLPQRQKLERWPGVAGKPAALQTSE